MKVITAILAAALLSTAPALGADEKYAGIHSVGIISGIGDVLRFRDYDRFTHSTRVAWDLNIRDWKIDEAVARKISEAISPGIVVKPVTFNDTWIYRGRYAAFEPLERRLRDYVRNMPASNGVDAYIIVQKDFGATARQDSFSPLMGLQVNRFAEPFAFTSKTPVYVDYTVFVIKAGTGEPLDHVFAEASDKFWEESEPISYRDNIWADSEGELTVAQREELKSIVMPTVMTTLSNVLERLGLASKSAPAASKRP